MSKVCYIGHFKTGTVSFWKAMQKLKYNSVHFPMDYFQYLDDYGNVSWPTKYTAFSNCNEIEYPLVDKTYPNSKFVYPLRPVEDWLESIELFLNRPGRDVQADYWIDRRLKKCLGSESFNRALYRKSYLAHQEKVFEYFEGRDNFLALDLYADDKWGPLCKFLDKPIPKREYPHLHKMRGK